jgi:hypothetical protein
MSNDNQKKNRNEVYRILEDVEKTAPQIEQIGHDMVGSARLARDVATILRDVVDKIDNDDMLSEEEWQRGKEGWGAVQQAAQPLLGAKSFVDNYSLTVSGSTVSSFPIVHYSFVPVKRLEPVLALRKISLVR